jgi:hypothetical protein
VYPYTSLVQRGLCFVLSLPVEGNKSFSIPFFHSLAMLALPLHSLDANPLCLVRTYVKDGGKLKEAQNLSKEAAEVHLWPILS